MPARSKATCSSSTSRQRPSSLSTRWWPRRRPDGTAPTRYGCCDGACSRVRRPSVRLAVCRCRLVDNDRQLPTRGALLVREAPTVGGRLDDIVVVAPVHALGHVLVAGERHEE